jgi:hydroxyacylglutathione hydrolase
MDDVSPADGLLMKMRTLIVGPVSCTCCIVVCAETGEAAVVDPGGDADAILAEVADMGVTVRHVLHTHGHFDHVMGTKEVVAATGAEVSLHRQDGAIYEHLTMQAMAFGFYAEQPPGVSRWLVGGESLTIGKLKAEVIHTPGHTPGSVGFYFAKPESLLLAGDTLFADAVGRTDFPGGSFEQLQVSIRDRLYVLPDETRVIPGHGPETTIGYERENNPFVRARRGE